MLLSQKTSHQLICPINGNFMPQRTICGTNSLASELRLGGDQELGRARSPVMSTPENCFLSVGQLQCISFDPHPARSEGQDPSQGSLAATTRSTSRTCSGPSTSKYQNLCGLPPTSELFSLSSPL